jgi:hypothetical protein
LEDGHLPGRLPFWGRLPLLALAPGSSGEYNGITSYVNQNCKPDKLAPICDKKIYIITGFFILYSQFFLDSHYSWHGPVFSAVEQHSPIPACCPVAAVGFEEEGHEIFICRFN